MCICMVNLHGGGVVVGVDTVRCVSWALEEFYWRFSSQSMGSAVNLTQSVAGNDVTPAIYVK